ncbi:unnamed protein product [Boreogadus saida]
MNTMRFFMTLHLSTPRALFNDTTPFIIIVVVSALTTPAFQRTHLNPVMVAVIAKQVTGHWCLTGRHAEYPWFGMAFYKVYWSHMVRGSNS